MKAKKYLQNNWAISTLVPSKYPISMCRCVAGHAVLLWKTNYKWEAEAARGICLERLAGFCTSLLKLCADQIWSSGAQAWVAGGVKSHKQNSAEETQNIERLNYCIIRVSGIWCFAVSCIAKKAGAFKFWTKILHNAYKIKTIRLRRAVSSSFLIWFYLLSGSLIFIIQNSGNPGPMIQPT